MTEPDRLTSIKLLRKHLKRGKKKKKKRKREKEKSLTGSRSLPFV